MRGCALNFSQLLEGIGDKAGVALAGLLVGLLFGFAAQRSQFCLRAATVEFWRGTIGRELQLGRALGPRTAIWLLVFGTALAGTQLLMTTGSIDAGRIRQLTATGTLSGAILGGLLFGVGMILARGCASRLLVLSATGNLRALVSGLILTVTAQAALSGVLSPLRLRLSELWSVSAHARNLNLHLPAGAGLVLGIVTMAIAVLLVARHRLSIAQTVAGACVGGAVVLGWWSTSLIAGYAFDVVAVESVTFTGPSADTLMVLIAQPDVPYSFGLGLVPGVFAGSLASALLAGEVEIQTFTDATPLPRYIIGAVLMGFGSMLAGGCAVGAGVTGGSIMALTAWVALLSMWVGAGLADLAVDRPKSVTSGASTGSVSATQ